MKVNCCNKIVLNLNELCVLYGTLHSLVAAVMNKLASETIMTGETPTQATSNTSAPPTATTSTITSNSSTILPEKLESGNIVLWLPQFETCATANGWQARDKTNFQPSCAVERPPISTPCAMNRKSALLLCGKRFKLNVNDPHLCRVL